ncbi:MAG: SEC-C domain-containing protein [bacterium]
MINQTTVELVGNVINQLIDYVYKDERVSADLNSYLQMIGFQGGSKENLQKVLMPYIFERRIGEERETVFDLFLGQKALKKDEKEVVEALKENIASVYQVKKLFKIGFELFNIVNEKTYATYSMVKMTNLRGVGLDQYIIARIFPYKNEYYMLELNEIIPQVQEEKAFRLAVAKQIQEPKMLYQDNPEKFAEIQSEIKKTGELFEEFFGSKQIITVNKKADELLGLFNEFVEGAKKPPETEIIGLIEDPKSAIYFDVSSESGDFLETAAAGFGSQNRSYDIALVYDDELGLFVIPFLNTFLCIFKDKNYEQIDGYKECIRNFLESDKIPPFVLKMAYSLDNKRFLDIVNEATGASFKSFKAIEKKYKYEYLESSKFSSTTVLYLSKAFSKLMGFANKEQSKVPANVGAVGRNEPCPCGSGKKYKKCCL